MRGNFWTKIGAKAGVVAVIFTLWFFRQGRIEQSKKLESKPLIPKPLKPHELPLDQNPLAVAAIHATLLAIFLGVLSTY